MYGIAERASSSNEHLFAFGNTRAASAVVEAYPYPYGLLYAGGCGRSTKEVRGTEEEKYEVGHLRRVRTADQVMDERGPILCGVLPNDLAGIQPFKMSMLTGILKSKRKT